MKILQVSITLSDEEFRILSLRHDVAGIKILVGESADSAIAKEVQRIEDITYNTVEMTEEQSA